MRKCCPMEHIGSTRIDENDNDIIECLLLALCRVFYIHYLIFLQPCIIENFQTYKSRIIQWTPVCSLPIFNSWPVLFHLCPYFFPLSTIFWNQFQTNTVSSVRFQYALYRVHFSLSFFSLQFTCWGNLVVCPVEFPTIWIYWLIPQDVI